MGPCRGWQRRLITPSFLFANSMRINLHFSHSSSFVFRMVHGKSMAQLINKVWRN
jgi:hypothetical protein